MGNKIFRWYILFAVLTCTLLNNLNVLAEPGNTQWIVQDLPTSKYQVMLNGSSISGIAVGVDGNTIYVCDNGIPPTDGIYKSADAGQSFNKMNNNYAGGTPKAIAVAPDDVNTVAITDGASVWVTTNGGSVWSSLPNPLVGAYAAAIITDIDVSPSIPGTLLGREYSISVSDPTTGVAGTARGDLLMFGSTSTWVTAGASASGASYLTGAFDFTSIVFTPNFAYDRCIVAVGTKSAAGSTAVVIVNTVTHTVVNNIADALVATGTILDPAPTGTTTEFGVTGTGILSSSIALPSDFNPTNLLGCRGYVGIASWTSTDNDVYRFDSNSAKALGAATNVPVKSIAYSGTLASGILFAGFYENSDVKYTTDMTSSSPTWTTSVKVPFGTNQTDYPGFRDLINTEKDFNLFQLSTINGATGSLFLDAFLVNKNTFSLKINYDLSSPINWSTVWIRRNLPTFLDISQFKTLKMLVYGDGKQETLGIDFTDDKGWVTRYYGQVKWSGWKEIDYDLKIDATAPFNTIADLSRIKSITFLINDNQGLANVQGSLNIESVQIVGDLKVQVAPISMIPFTSSKVVVAVPKDYASTKRVFAATSGFLSAFCISTNGGISFDGESLIDNGAANNVGVIDGIEFSSDGAWLFLISHTNGILFLYKSDTSVTSLSWRLVLAKPGTQGLLKLNSDWGTMHAVYLADMVTNANFYVSQNSGATFSIRKLPTGTVPTALAVLNDGTVYLAGGSTTADAGYIFHSTNSGFVWDRQSDSHITNIVSIHVPLPGTLIVGGSGAVSYSIDDGNTFTRIDAGLPAAPATYQVMADVGYANNFTIFAGSSLAAPSGTIYRYKIGTSDTWKILTYGAPGEIVGIASQSGACYGMGATSAIRSINPLDDNQPYWVTMNIGGVAGAKWFTTVGLPSTNILYAANDSAINPTMWALDDWLALTKPIPVSPPDGTIVPVNPATGFAEDVTLSWQPTGSGTGIVNRVTVEILTPSGVSTDFEGIAINPLNPCVRIVAGVNTVGDVIGYNMLPGCEYLWHAKFVNTVNQAKIESDWCKPRTIKVQLGSKVSQPYIGPLLANPPVGASDIDPDQIGFTWAPVHGATEYQLVIATDAALTDSVADTPTTVSTSAYLANGLEYGKTYFWAVKATIPAESVQSVGTFTTMGKPAKLPPTVIMKSPVYTPSVSEFTSSGRENLVIVFSVIITWVVFFVVFFIVSRRHR